VIEHDLEFLKTHSIQQLRDLLASAKVSVSLSDEQCELLDSIYLPSKYPLGSALPASDPDLETCQKCAQIADDVLQDVHAMLSQI
jgi:HEPN domain-containing protein